MDIIKALQDEWESESASTRKLLMCVPQDKLTWKSTPKSMSIGDLAMHIANIPSWASATFDQTVFDMPKEKQKSPTSTKEILDAFDKNSKLMVDKLKKATVADLDVIWTFKSGGVEYFKMPRYNVVRQFIISHIIHHRGYLLAYLRSNNVKVPGMYGPGPDDVM